MIVRNSLRLALWAAVVAIGAPLYAAPKIIEGFQSTVQPGPTKPSPATSDTPTPPLELGGDAADLFGEAGPADGNAPSTGPNIWDMPQLQLQVMQLRLMTAALFQQEKFADAETRCQQSVDLIPHDPAGHYLLACTQAKQGKIEAALASLKQAVRWGFNQAEVMDRDPNLAALHGNLDFAMLIADAKSAVRPPSPWRHHIAPATPNDGKVVVSASNTAWDAKHGVFISLLRPPMADPAVKVPLPAGGGLDVEISRWYAEGTAAGNIGDFYDNHDQHHSTMHIENFPQMTEIVWDEETRRRQFHTGLQTRFFFTGVVLGNSSTAMVNGPFWRSQPRLAYVNARNAAVLYTQYTKNHLYFYPEHTDHDLTYGDVFPANTPYVVISQGSSYSDQAFIDAFAYALAALRPDVKAMLVKQGALMPTLQMIFRRTNANVPAEEDYLTGAAHPTVFQGEHLRPAAMVAMAHNLTVDNLPPLVRMKVLEDDPSVPGVDYFDIGPRQELFTTPSAVARVHRTANYKYRMVVSAEESVDLTGKPLTYHWKLLRGDDSLVEIKPLNESGSIVELIVPFHAKRPIGHGSGLVSNRVDIGCFVSNGKYYSAPGFVTFFTLANERRTYYSDLKPQTMKYSLDSDYVDPMIDVSKAWTDTYHYHKKQLIGWTRERGDARESFTADGALVISRDERDRPLTARTVKYIAQRKDGAAVPLLEQQLGNELLHYEYTSPEDKRGAIARREPTQ